MTNPWRAAALHPRASGAALLACSLSLAATLIAPAAHAEATPPPAAAAPVAPADPRDARVEEKLGKLLRDTVASGRMSGAVMVYVRDGKIALAEGFGYEDPVSHNPIDPSKSRFLVNSVSKVFAAVAIAQLKSRGLIGDYHDPVNRYLTGYRLPDSYGRAITLEELLTHTEGLDEGDFDVASARPETRLPTPADYEAHRPKYIVPPDVLPVYTSFGIDMLGLVVSDVTHMPYRTYLENYILKPLDMTSTLVDNGDQPIPHEVFGFLPTRPEHVEPILYKQPFAWPEGALFSTGEDMGKFMIALLDHGASQSTITAGARDDLFGMHHEVVPGLGYGMVFEISHLGSEVAVYHRGGGSGMVCGLITLPARRVGLFECITNTRAVRGTPADKLPIDDAVVDKAAFDALIPATDYPAAVPEWNDAWSARIGNYVWTDRHHYGFGRLIALLHPDVLPVRRGKSGLQIAGIDGFREISPGHFAAPGVLETFTFFNKPDFGPLLIRGTNASSFELPGPLDNPHLIDTLLALVLAASASAVIWPLWPYARGRRLASAAALLFGVCMIGGTGVLFITHAQGFRYSIGTLWPILLVRACGFLVIPVALALVWSAIRAPRAAGAAATLARIHLALLAAAAVVAVAALMDVGVIGFYIR
jgi:CubicO group peptidase (beta-lactamase class C family)